MHKDGWISGSLYLAIERRPGTSEGNIVFTKSGPDYPAENGPFPEEEYEVNYGDIILFPSSLFHSTIENGDMGRRVVLAFDIKPVV